MKNETKKNIIDKAAELLLKMLDNVDVKPNEIKITEEAVCVSSAAETTRSAAYLSEVVKNINEIRTDEDREELDRALEESKKRIAEITNRARERNKDQAVITCINNTQH